MPGFPTRPTKAAFGSTLVERYPTNDPTKEIAALIQNLRNWQQAGLGVVSPLAWAEIVVDGADAITLGASAEAWDANGGFVPGVSKIGVGQYRLTYAATYLDETGVAIATNLTFGLPTVRSATFFHCQHLRVSNILHDIYIFDSANAPDDPTSASVFVPLW